MHGRVHGHELGTRTSLARSSMSDAHHTLALALTLHARPLTLDKRQSRGSRCIPR